MRKLSCKWPIWITVYCFASPAFYIFFRIRTPHVFDGEELAQKAVGGAVIAIIIWLVYGIACLFAPKK